MKLTQFIDEHQGIIDSYIKACAPLCPIDAQERFAWCHIDEELYYVARGAGVTDLPDLEHTASINGHSVHESLLAVPPGGIWSAPQPAAPQPQTSGRL